MPRWGRASGRGSQAGWGNGRVERVRRRLLILNTDLELGGTPTVVREIATRLHAPPETGVEVACLGKWGPVADQIQRGGIEVTALGAKGISDLWVVRRLIDRVRGRG